MEPCAPGTEDDPPIMYSTLTKQENEQERLLKQKAILKNGQYDNIFELSYVNGAEHWFCRVCQCPVMGRVYQHEIGKRHTQNLAITNRHLEKQQHKEELPEESITMDIAPGEPVPPGYEGEIGRIAQIQERLDGFKVGPLVALEYLLELQDYDPSKEPVYLCILCDKKGDPRTVLTHLASYNHISQYLQKHFPTCYRALAPYMTKQYKRNWQTTLQKVAEGIEKKFGRLKPYPIEKDKFEKERMHYLHLIGKGRHFSEQSGWTFEELIVHDELTKTYDEEKTYENISGPTWGGAVFIQKPFKKRSPSPPVVASPMKKTKGNAQTNPKRQLPAYIENELSNTSSRAALLSQIRRRSLSSVSSISSSDLSDGESGIKKNAQTKNLRNASPPLQRGRQLPYERRRTPTPRHKSPPRRGERELPWQNSSYQRQKNEFAEKKMTEKEKEKIRKIEEFRKLARAIENDMHKTLKQHEKNPEKHPQYSDEWKKFWNKRYKELQAQGVDVSKHDFKPEWIEFWNKRMIEIHSDELRSRKDALRKRLGLPDEPMPIKFKIGISGKSSPKENKPILPMAAEPDQDNEVIIIDDKDDDKKSINRSHSPWENETPLKSKAHQAVRSKSRERTSSRMSASRDRSRSRDISRSKDYKDRRSYSKERRSRSRDRRSHSRDRRSRSRDRRSRSRDRRSRSRERRTEYRESSYERDLRGKERVRTVADLPWERDKVYRNAYEDYYKPPPVMRDVTRKPVIIPDAPVMPIIMPAEEEDDGEVNIVDVLRILTALEERLGSLGPKVIDLLAQALALEKKEANSSETLLHSDINCVLFETVKEKLKGQLLAGLVDVIQERAFKKAIKKTASLIHIASQRKKQRERFMPKIKPVTVPGVGTVDKAAIAKQIANALILQGKTDVTQAELEQLINAVVGMAEASKNSSKPVTTASFLQQIAESNIPSSDSKLSEKKEEKEPEEKIIIPTCCKKPEVVDLEKLTEPLTPSPGKNSISNMENLSDSDLQTLLQNFKDLSTDEQHNLINYLKKLELHEPERVEHLRQFVDLDTGPKPKDETSGEATEGKKKLQIGKGSPFSNRLGGVNPVLEDLVRIESDEENMDDFNQKERKIEEKDKPAGKIHLDSEDEDYTFEDVVKAASKNVKDKELENNMKIVEASMKFESNKIKTDADLNDAKALISNLMSNFSKMGANSENIDLLGLGVSSANPSTSVTNVLTSSADFAKTFSNINVANLASIVNNVKKMSPAETNEKPFHFEPPSPVRSNTGKLNFDPLQLSPNPSVERSFGEPRGNVPFSRSPDGDNIGPDHFDRGLSVSLRGGPGMGPSSNLIDRGRSGLNIGVARDVGFRGSNVGPNREIPYTQYPRNNGPYPSNYGNNNYSPQENVQYPNVRNARSNIYDQRSNPRFNNYGGNDFSRSGAGTFNRW